MDFQELYELADKEVSLGLADEKLLERAYAEVNGGAHGRQVYCQLRAKALEKKVRESASEAYVFELQLLIENQEKRLLARKERHRWMWAITCFAAIIGTIVFSRFAISAYHQDSGSFYALGFLSIGCLLLTAIAYTASRYHTYFD